MKTLAISPKPTDALSYYRAMGPLRRLRETYRGQFDFTQNSSLNWAVMAEYDNMFLHRPYTNEHTQIVDIAQKWQVPMWGDYDDWLIELPSDNPAKHVFDGASKDIVQCAKAMDLLFVTTEKLKQLYETIGAKNVVVVPNAYDHKLFSYAKEKREKLKICLWRGSNTHNADLKSILPGLERVIEAFPDWQFVFAACDPRWMMSKSYANIHHVGGKDMMGYMHMIWSMSPSVMYHPLVDNEFNRAKSMCSWLEATHASSAFVGPNFEEFNRPGITNYEAGNSDSFFESMHSLLSNPATIDEKRKMSEEHILNHLTLEKVNEIRWEAIKKLQTK